MRGMTIEEFNKLDEGSKRIIIFEAEKVSEVQDEFTKYLLFMIYDFYIEIKTSISNVWKRTIVTYKIDDVPLKYAGDVREKLLEKY